MVDRSHPSLVAADLTIMNTLVSAGSKQGAALKHGTHVASILFGQQEGSIVGIAPRCRGMIFPIYNDGPDQSRVACSQLDLARAILQAVHAGAHVINISGGESSPSGAAHPILADAVRKCSAQGVLIVAAAGNQGCECLQIPGALPAVLAVGAMDSKGMPLEFSNWGKNYQVQGILAPGENIVGASPGNGITANSGTSYATPIVSGIAALLVSLQLKKGFKPDPHAVRAAILSTAIGCNDLPIPDCRRLLAGRLNIKGAMHQIIKGGTVMSDSTEMTTSGNSLATLADESKTPDSQLLMNGIQAADSEIVQPEISDETRQFPKVESETLRNTPEKPTEESAVYPNEIKSSTCSCGGSGNASIQLVYALGLLGFDFGTEARRDSIAQHMNGNPSDPNQLLAYLDENPWDAESIIWTLNLDATSIYAVMPHGVFAGEGYKRLRQFLKEQLTEGVERISVPGIIVGKARLLIGQVVPVIQPAIRCMYSWTTAALVDAVVGKSPGESDDKGKKRQDIKNFLERIYHELRNLGITSQERAINYAATNAFNIEKIFESALKAKMELDTIEVERSPICRPDSDCWDVKLLFFDPENVLRSRKVYRFTVDVSDVCPVTIGEIRSWSLR